MVKMTCGGITLMVYPADISFYKQAGYAVVQEEKPEPVQEEKPERKEKREKPE